MTVSAGFYKKIKHWVLDSSENIAYQPFQLNGNPYKSNIFILNAIPEPAQKVEKELLEPFIHSLVDAPHFQQLFTEAVDASSREYKGCLNFQKWMKEQWNEEVVLSSVNCLMADASQLKALKKQQDPLYKKGIEISQDVLQEFSPDVLIIQGTTAWKSLLEQYEDQLIDFHYKDYTVQQLESVGPVAKLALSDGKIMSIFACRSMGYFGKVGTSFVDFKYSLQQYLNK